MLDTPSVPQAGELPSTSVTVFAQWLPPVRHSNHSEKSYSSTEGTEGRREKIKGRLLIPFIPLKYL